MDDSKLGKRNKRDDWSPHKPVVYPPLFVWPPKPLALVKWFAGLPGYLFPWTVFYIAVSVLTYAFLTPSAETMKTFSWDWTLFLLARNWAYVFIFYGGLYLLFYIKRTQGNTFKFNGRWPEVGKAHKTPLIAVATLPFWRGYLTAMKKKPSTHQSSYARSKSRLPTRLRYYQQRDSSSRRAIICCS